MDRISLYHLRTLAAVDRLGTFRAAAESLGTTQPAVTARMRELSAQLGVRLFQPDGRRLVLTARARELVVRSVPILDELEALLADTADGRLLAGRVRVGTGEIAATNFLPRFVSAAATAFPRMTLEISVDLTARMLDDLLSSRRDLVLLAGPVSHSAIRTMRVGDVSLQWLGSPATLKGLHEGRAAPIWTLAAHSPLHALAQEALASGAVRGGPLNTCNNVRALIDIVSFDGGVALIPETMARAECANGTLVEAFPAPASKIEFQAALRRRETDPLLLRLFELAVGIEIDPK